MENNTLYPQKKNKTGYVRLRKNGRILRYHRFKRTSDEYNWMRVQVMVFLPWIEEIVTEEEVRRHYFDNFKTIELNRLKFEQLDYDRFEQQAEVLELEIQERYNEMNKSKAFREHQAHQQLIRSLSNVQISQEQEVFNREEVEDEFGYVQF